MQQMTRESTPRPEVGLCAACDHGSEQRNPRGNTFWRCLRAESDAAFVRYPPLPVSRCPGFEASGDSA